MVGAWRARPMHLFSAPRLASAQPPAWGRRAASSVALGRGSPWPDRGARLRSPLASCRGRRRPRPHQLHGTCASESLSLVCNSRSGHDPQEAARLRRRLLDLDANSLSDQLVEAPATAARQEWPRRDPFRSMPWYGSRPRLGIVAGTPYHNHGLGEIGTCAVRGAHIRWFARCSSGVSRLRDRRV